MALFTDNQRTLLRHAVNTAKGNRHGSRIHLLGPQFDAESPDAADLVERGLMVTRENGFSGAFLYATQAGIAALAEVDAMELMAKFEHSDHLGTVVFELAKRVAILEANT